MTNYVLLNNAQHINLKIAEGFSPESGDNKAAVLTFPTEFADIQREYPIFLSRDPETNRFRAVAMLGIQKDENLFLEVTDSGSRWLGSYVPAIVARGPFIIGLPEQPEADSQAVVYVDLEHPRVSETEGRPLFLEFGGNSPYLDYMTKVLSTIHQGTEIGNAMFGAFDELGLIEPLTVNIDLKNGDKHRLDGYHTINEEKLANLTGADLEKLNRAGYLQGAFLILSSHANLQKLIEIKNSRL